MVKIKDSKKIGNNLVFTLSGDTDMVCNGYEFMYNQKKYRVKTVAMVCNKQNVKQESIDVTAEEI